MSTASSRATQATDVSAFQAQAHQLSTDAVSYDLFQRLATARAAINGRLVFTTSFGLEDQAIGHAILSQALDIEVVTLDTGRLFDRNACGLGRDRTPVRSAYSGYCP